jgi:hypothetical protein
MRRRSECAIYPRRPGAPSRLASAQETHRTPRADLGAGGSRVVSHCEPHVPVTGVFSYDAGVVFKVPRERSLRIERYRIAATRRVRKLREFRTAAIAFGGGPFAVSMKARSVSEHAQHIPKAPSSVSTALTRDVLIGLRRKGNSRIGSRTMHSLLVAIMLPRGELHRTGGLMRLMLRVYGLVHIV